MGPVVPKVTRVGFWLTTGGTKGRYAQKQWFGLTLWVDIILALMVDIRLRLALMVDIRLRLTLMVDIRLRLALPLMVDIELRLIQKVDDVSWCSRSCGYRLLMWVGNVGWWSWKSRQRLWV